MRRVTLLLLFVSVASTTALPAIEDDVAQTTVQPPVVVVEDLSISDAVEEVTTQRVDEFPTPKPFLFEPISGERIHEIEPPRNPVSHTFNPEKYDVKVKVVNNTSFYIGKAACQCGRPGDRKGPPGGRLELEKVRYAAVDPQSTLRDNQFGNKIVNGVEARIEEYPWTVALLRRSWLGSVSRSPYCGGTLINNQWVVTASHCVDGMSASGIVAALHEENFDSDNEVPAGTTKIDVARIIMHKNYNRNNIDYDIALLKLKEPVQLGNVFIPACLPANNDYDFAGVTGTVAGWGTTKEGGSQSRTLMKVDVPIIGNDDCNTKTKYKGKITDQMMCAGYIQEGGKDSCQGDSGGPMTIENGSRRTLVGVVSWGYGCARPQSPGVYARVGRFPEWILENTVGADWCKD